MLVRNLRRTLLALLFATGPLVTACELAFDFDRTPLQPVYEGGAGVPEDASSERTPTRDAQGGG
jgi:hypothetical protein